MRNTIRAITTGTRGADTRQINAVHGSPTKSENLPVDISSQLPNCQYLAKSAPWKSADRTQFAIQASVLVVASHRATGGATVSLSEGNLIGLPLFAVAGFPGRSVDLSEPPDPANIYAFISSNIDILQYPGLAVGSWFDTRQEIHVLDIVLCTQSRELAVNLAIQFRQQSIYDLAGCQEIVIVSGDAAMDGSRYPAQIVDPLTCLA